MKILVLAPQPFFITRGTPIDVDILVRALTLRGDEVHLVCYDAGEDRDYPGLSIHRIHGPAWLDGMRPGFSFRKLVADLYLARAALRITRDLDFDIVHAGEEAVFIAMALKRLRGIPYIYDMDSSIAQQMVEQNPLLRAVAPLFNRVERAAIRRSLAAAPVCNALAELARSAGAPYVETLHDISQLDDPDKQPAALLQEWGIERPVILYVGNLEPYQGVDLLLEGFAVAVERGLQFDLLVAGGREDDIARYRAKCERLGVVNRCHWIGWWPNQRLDELLAEAAVVTAPRIKGVNTPMKIFPYLHSGKPLLATAHPTHTQILTDDVAFLADPDPESFAEAMLRLERESDLRARLGAAGRRFVEEGHTFPAHRERVERLYSYAESAL